MCPETISVSLSLYPSPFSLCVCVSVSVCERVGGWGKEGGWENMNEDFTESTEILKRASAKAKRTSKWKASKVTKCHWKVKSRLGNCPKRLGVSRVLVLCKRKVRGLITKHGAQQKAAVLSEQSFLLLLLFFSPPTSPLCLSLHSRHDLHIVG